MHHSPSHPCPLTQTHSTDNNRHNAIEAETYRSRATKDDTETELSARSPSPSRRHQQPTSWVSPGKAAATAAAAAAKEAARAAEASVRAAEAAADAAEAAEAAAEAEEEIHQPSPGGGNLRSSPASSECHERHSPARSAFWLTEGDKEGPTESHKGSGGPKRRSPLANDHASTNRKDGEEGGERGGGDSPEGRVGRRGQDDGVGGKGENVWRREGSERGSSEEEMLKKARDQVGLCF